MSFEHSKHMLTHGYRVLVLIGGARTPASAQEIDMLIETHILKDHLIDTCVVRVGGSMF